jgi:hypothetical protein
MLEELIFEKRGHKKSVYNYVTVKKKVIRYRNPQLTHSLTHSLMELSPS